MKTILKNEISNYLYSHKKTSRVLHKDEHIETIVDALFAVNAMTEYEVQCGGYHVSDAELPSWVEPFVLPAKVSLQAHPQAKDILVRPQVDPTFKWDPIALHQANNLIAASLKIDNLPMKKVVDLRGGQEVFSNLNYSIKGIVPGYKETAFVPIPIDEALADFINTTPVATASEVFKLYMLTVFKIS